MIDPAFDPAPSRAALQRDGRVQVRGFLQPAVAARLRDCLLHEVPWTLALRDADGPRTLDAAAYASLDAPAVAALLARARDTTGLADTADAQFRFAYDSYMMVRAYKEGRDPGLLLHRVLEVFNTPDFHALARALTGDARIARVDAQATRYRAGHFLREHTDHDTREGRLYAYVLNLSDHWHPDWGGLLHFIDGDAVTATFVPSFNTLNVFRVPTAHAVSQVMDWARGPRLSITGWWMEGR